MLGLIGMLLFELLLVDAWPAAPDSMRDPPHEPAPYVTFVARPGFRIERPKDVQSHGQATGRISVNSAGFRGPEWPSPQKQMNEIRVAVLGGSAVFYGLTDERTMPAFLSGALARRLDGAAVTALNGGIISANSTQELALLRSRLVDLRPDVIVVYDGFNDIWDPLYYDGRVGQPPDFVGIERPSVARLAHLLYRLGRSIGAVQGILQVTGFLSRDETPYASRSDPRALEALPDDAARQLLGNWRAMADVCRSAGIQCIFALQPTLLYRSGALADDARTRIPPAERDAIERYYAAVEREIGDGAPAAFHGATAVSLAGLFGGSAGAAFWDAVHLYDEANAVVADRVAAIACDAASALRCR